MSKNEIKLDKYKLSEINGNLKQLLYDLSNMPKFTKTPAKESIGFAAQEINNVSEELIKVYSSLIDLLENSIAFFENLGVSFEDADENAAKEISSKL